MNINNLPLEILWHIGSHFDGPQTQASALATCSLWNQLFNDDKIWNCALRHYAVDYPQEDKKDLVKIAHRFEIFHQKAQEVSLSIDRLCQKQAIPSGLISTFAEKLHLRKSRCKKIEKKKMQEFQKAADLQDQTFDLEEEAFKLMFGPKLYHSFPDIRELSPIDYSFSGISKSESYLHQYLGGFRSEKYPVVKGTICDLRTYDNQKIDKVSFVIMQYCLKMEKEKRQKGAIVLIFRKRIDTVPCRLFIDAYSPNSSTPIYLTSINPYSASEMRQLIHKKVLFQLRPVYNDPRWKKKDPQFMEIMKTEELGLRWVSYSEEMLPKLYEKKVTVTIGY